MGTKSRKPSTLKVWQQTAEAALNGAMEHWKYMQQNGISKLHRPTGTQCPCCVLFRENDCASCPVALRAGASYCLNTPWAEAASSIKDGDHTHPSVQAEIDFLRTTLSSVESREIRPSADALKEWRFGIKG